MGIGSACLGNPIHAARWLADVLCQRGIPLQPGDVLMTGALGPMQSISTGDEVTVDFGPLGTVATRIADE
jgi:2-keto-4-pentenoate hydratase